MNTAQGALALVQTDILTVMAVPLQALLAAIRPPASTAPNANVVIGAWIQFYGALLVAVPALDGETATQIITSLQSKISVHLTPKTA
jgi:hypothetical protein